MNRFFTLSLATHAAVMALFALMSADWLTRREPAPIGAFSVSLDQIDSSVSAIQSRSPSPMIAIPKIAKDVETSASEPNVEAAHEQQGEAAASSGLAGVPDGVAAGIRERYLFELRLLIDREKKYPLAAKEMRQQGRVEVAFLVTTEGKFQGVEVVGQSPFERLNKAALALVEGVGAFRPLPNELGSAPLRVSLPIDYVLK